MFNGLAIVIVRKFVRTNPVTSLVWVPAGTTLLVAGMAERVEQCF